MLAVVFWPLPPLTFYILLCLVFLRAPFWFFFALNFVFFISEEPREQGGPPPLSLLVLVSIRCFPIPVKQNLFLKLNYLFFFQGGVPPLHRPFVRFSPFFGFFTFEIVISVLSQRCFSAALFSLFCLCLRGVFSH